MNTHEDLTRSNETAWNRAAAKYASEVERDVEFLRGGGISLMESERRILGNLADYSRAIHLQCSHGLDTLSLLNLGVSEVVGVDISQAMLAQAKQKAQRLGAPAQWMLADVLDVPRLLDGSADLVYTGKGALPWVLDLSKWARVIRRLLHPGGQLYVFEGHPLNWVWEPEKSMHCLSRDGRGYFDAEPRLNQDFPASAVARFTPAGEPVPNAWERQWGLGEVVTVLVEAGLFIERLEEHAEHFWPQFPNISSEEVERLPHSFSILARAPAT